MNQLPPELLRYGAIALGLVVVASVVSKMFKSKATPDYLEKRKCPSCGFVGSVSKHKPRCNKCGAAL